MPASCVSIVIATIDSDLDDEFNKWYNEVHLPEIVTCPGFISGTRYVADTPNGRQYLAIYELESEAAFASEELKARRGWGPFTGRVSANGRIYNEIYHVTADELKKGARSPQD